MKQPRWIEVRESEVPLGVVYRGQGGRVEYYELRPAGRKFGLSLQAASALLKELLARRR